MSYFLFDGEIEFVTKSLFRIGPNKDVSPSSGDRRLAQCAQMYHYQHQKNLINSMENPNSGEQNGSLSDIETDEENEEGDYTVYECPGLAPVRMKLLFL